MIMKEKGEPVKYAMGQLARFETTVKIKEKKKHESKANYSSEK
jgi:hypothetical protein